MCIIIDTDVFASVFDSQTKYHAQYKPVKDWIIESNGKLVLGGSTYHSQVIERKYYRIIRLLSDAEKVLILNYSLVDKNQEQVAKIIPTEDFDDKHIAAIARVSGCKLICTRDSSSIPYLKDLRLYRTREESPKFYTSKKNQDLLVPTNIADCCKPAKKTTKAQKAQMRNL